MSRPAVQNVHLRRYWDEPSKRAMIDVTSPYHPDWVARARHLGGSWQGEVWEFDARAEDGVRGALRAVYGEDGLTPPRTVDLRLTRLDGAGAISAPEVYFAGRQLLVRRYRDYAVTVGPGVILVSGSFESSGGSRANPAIGVVEDVVLDVLDVPEVFHSLPGWSAEVIGPEPEPWRAELEREREELQARLAEVNRLLSDGVA